MKVVIIGAGTIGLATARLLSEEGHEVVLVDRSESALIHAAQVMDIATRRGSGIDWRLLEEIAETRPELFLALTPLDEVNLASCAIAKGLGLTQTVARVSNLDILNPTRLDFGRIFAVDYFVCPELLAAQDIYKYLLSLGSMRMESYAHGAVQMRTLTVPSKFGKSDKPLSEIHLPEGVMVGLVARTIRERGSAERQQIIFPHGEDRLLPGDEVTIVGVSEAAERIHTFFGITQRRIANAVILGGELTGEYLASTLSEKGIHVRIVEPNMERCAKLSERLPRVTVINHDGTDLGFLKAERVDQADVVVACSRSEEANVLACLLARQVGCDTVVALVGDKAVGSMLKDLGISHFASPLSSAANRIFAIAGARILITTSALYGNRAKIMELTVSPTSKIVGIPLSELRSLLPRDFLFAFIQNRGRIMIAHGKRTLCPGDTVIVIASPKHTEEILHLF